MMENKISKSVAILDILAASDGMRYTDIQKALWRMSHLRPFTRNERGYWSTNLTSGGFWSGRQGLLARYATKGADGLWRRNNVPHNGKPWASININRESDRPKSFYDGCKSR